PALSADGNIATSLAARKGFESCRIYTCIWLSDAEPCLFITLDKRRQKALLLLFCTKSYDRIQSKDIHVNGRNAAHACSRLGNGLDHNGCLLDAQPCTTVLCGHTNAKPASLGNCSVEIKRKSAVPVTLKP